MYSYEIHYSRFRENKVKPPLRTPPQSPVHEHRCKHPPTERQPLRRASTLAVFGALLNARPRRVKDAFAKMLVKAIVNAKIKR